MRILEGTEKGSLVPSGSGTQSSPIQEIASKGVMSYGSFQDWLDSFTPKETFNADMDAIANNIRAAKARGKRNPVSSGNEPVAPPSPVSLRSITSGSRQTQTLNPIRIIVKGLIKDEERCPVTEEVVTSTSDEIYSLLKIFRERGKLEA